MAQQLGSNYYNSPFKFNGKELDEETGFYYYGARYYDPKISIWLSTDPLAEKFPNFNPYNYVMQNPLNLTDPTGMEPEEGGNDPKRINIVVLPKNISKTDKALNNIKYSAENDLSDNVLILYVKDIKDLGEQIKKNKVESIGTITNVSHGNYDENSISIGNQKIKSEKDFKMLGETLSPYVDDDSLIVLHSCHAGSGKNTNQSNANIKALGDTSGASVVAPMTWGRGSSSLFNGERGAVSAIPTGYENNWKKTRFNSGSNLNTYKKYNPNPYFWEDKFSTFKNGKFQKNGTFTF